MPMKEVQGHLQRWDVDGIHLLDGHNYLELSFVGLDPDTVELLKTAASMMIGTYVVCSFDKYRIQLQTALAHHASA